MHRNLIGGRTVLQGGSRRRGEWLGAVGCPRGCGFCGTHGPHAARLEARSTVIRIDVPTLSPRARFRTCCRKSGCGCAGDGACARVAGGAFSTFLCEWLVRRSSRSRRPIDRSIWGPNFLQFALLEADGGSGGGCCVMILGSKGAAHRGRSLRTNEATRATSVLLWPAFVTVALL